MLPVISLRTERLKPLLVIKKNRENDKTIDINHDVIAKASQDAGEGRKCELCQTNNTSMLLKSREEAGKLMLLRPQGGVPVKKFVIHDFHIWDSVFRELSRDELLLC